MQHYNGEYLDESNLVGYWDFNENTGQTTADSSGNGNDGTLGADSGSDTDDPTWVDYAPSWTRGVKGSALEFEGSESQRVEIKDASSLQFGTTQDFSIGFWAKSTSDLTGYHTLIGNRDANYGDGGKGFVFEASQSLDDIRARVGDGIVPYKNVILENYSDFKDGSWHYLYATFDRDGYLRGYYDGLLVNSEDMSSIADIDSGEDIFIAHEPKGAVYWDGSIDDVKIYNYARTPAQVAWDYNRGAPIAYWKFDECSGTTAHDKSGNGNTGTITIGASGTQTDVGTCASSSSAFAWYNGASGKKNGSLSFDGTDDYVAVSYTSTVVTTGEYSMSLWFNADEVERIQTLINISNGSTNRNGICIRSYDSAWRVTGGYYDGSYTGTSSGGITTGQWYHAVYINDSGSTSLYLNGVAQTLSNGGNLISGSNRIGGSTTNEYFNGQIDEVKIWNYVLTAEQVKAEYNNGAVRFE